MILIKIKMVRLSLAVLKVCWAYRMFCSRSLGVNQILVGAFAKILLVKQLQDNINEIKWANEFYEQESMKLLTRDV
jgi:hypothetical protein